MYVNYRENRIVSPRARVDVRVTRSGARFQSRPELRRIDDIWRHRRFREPLTALKTDLSATRRAWSTGSTGIERSMVGTGGKKYVCILRFVTET